MRAGGEGRCERDLGLRREEALERKVAAVAPEEWDNQDRYSD
jgi:hypothetical protein